MRLVDATKFQGKPMNNIEIAKLEFIIVMYYWKPSTPLKHIILSGSAKTDYTPQIEAFTSVCSEYEYERDFVWISPEEMFEHAGRNKSGNERHSAQAKTTLGKVNLVVDTWPIKAYVIGRIKYLLFLSFMFHLPSQNPWAKVRRGFEHAHPQNPLAPKTPRTLAPFT